MAADADTPDGALSEEAEEAASNSLDEGSPDSEVESGSATDVKPEAAEDDADEAGDHEAEDDNTDSSPEEEAPVKQPMSHVRLATLVGLLIVVALAATVGWSAFRDYESQQAKAQRQLFLQVGRQCALNLTTIDWQHAEADVQRLMDSATGKFYEQFSQREQPFIDVVKKAQSKSVGTITEAGLESDSSNKADVLVAVSIKTTNLGEADQAPREWRMRISVEKAGNDVKVSNVAFVP